MTKDFKFIFILFLCLALLSCGEYENLEIDKQAQRSADSLYRAHRDSLSSYFDSLCELDQDSLYQKYFDSLRVLELERIQKLIDK